VNSYKTKEAMQLSEEFKGRIKEAVGAITGDEEKKAEGQAQQRKAEAEKEAERYGGTRTYTLTYEGTDLAGNTQSCQATVTVPMG
jgi:uncharacterized protein YjbJ (UPF0337 family)